jgi:ketosteroid isomerase-like protein
MTTQTSNIAIGEGLIAGMRAGDLEAVLGLMHPDLEVFEPESLPYGGTWTGKDGFTALLQKLLGLAALAIDDARIHATGDGVIMEMQISFTSHKDGEVFRTSAVEIDRLKDGLVHEIDVYYKDVAATNDFFARQL